MKKYDGRLRIFSILIIVAALALVVRLYFLQIVSGSDYRDKAEHQYVAGANYFDRGTIYFSTKDGALVPGADLATGYILAINPTTLANSSSTEIAYERINAAVPIDQNTFFSKAEKKGDSYEQLADHVTQEQADAISKQKIPGVSLYKERWRDYPGQNLAAQTVGFIGYQGDTLAGRYGLERSYEATLQRSGSDTFNNFFAQIFSSVKNIAGSGEGEQGDIVTTIEPSVQSFLETELSKVNEQYSSEFSGGIIIDPKTGEIVAMAQEPSFDPNKRTPADINNFKNRLVEDRYEMGSIIKALTMAAGIDSGAITPKTTYNDPGCMTLNQKTFCNYDQASHGSNLPMQIVLDQSLNTGAAFVALHMGDKQFTDYMLKFGLASTTGIDLPNEGKSLVSNLFEYRDLETAEASFGQGIALTPIQTVRALSVIANGGYLITPHIVKEIKYSVGPNKTISYPRGPQVIKPGTSEEVSRMLTEVVDTALRGGGEKLANYSVAAKTGTAQIASPGGGYYADHYVHSFFGYFPSYDPKFLIFLYTYYPKGVQYSSETLTDTFIQTTKFLINYYNVPPDREFPPTPSVDLQKYL